MIIGVLSDTHGTLDPRAMAALRGVDRIIHAGDVGGPEVLAALEAIAPVNAVRGNMDGDDWGRQLPAVDMIELDGRLFYVLHDLNILDLDPAAAGIEVIISGHTHQPAIMRANDTLYFNPGSAGHGRHGAPPSVGRIRISAGGLHPEIIHLAGPAMRA